MVYLFSHYIYIPEEDELFSCGKGISLQNVHQVIVNERVHFKSARQRKYLENIITALTI